MVEVGGHWLGIGALALILTVSACGSSRKVVTRPRPVPVGVVGECADPERDGTLTATPRIERHDRDLDGDGRPELVVTDRAACSEQGNCYWNVFAAGADDDCKRFLGTIAGAALETLSETGDGGYHGVRAWWKLAGGNRLLMEEYRFRRGGYRVVDSLLCRRLDDDRIECAPPLRRGNGGLP